MKVNEIRKLSDKEINEKIVSCKEELFNLLSSNMGRS